MYTHSSLPLPKPQVSNFIEFINNHQLAKKCISTGPTPYTPTLPPQHLIQLVQVGQKICILITPPTLLFSLGHSDIISLGITLEQQSL